MAAVKVDSAIDLTAPAETGGTDTNAKAGLIGGALAAIGASVCCVGPLVLVTLGVSGAWISNFALLMPYRWLFVLAALGFMGYAWYRIYRAPALAACEPASVCALPQANRFYRVLFWMVSALVLLAVTSPYYLPLFY